MPDGAFQPEHRLADLTDEAADAAAEGYACLQVIADMSWALRPQPVAELVLSYEARLTPLCAEWRMAVACLYDLRRLSRHTSHRTYSTHPSTATGSRPRTGGPPYAEPHPHALPQLAPA